MLWETTARAGEVETSEPLPITEHDGLLRADWAPLVSLALDDAQSIARRSAKMHAVLAETLVEQARQLRERHGHFQVGLSGGVFLNRVLTEAAMRGLSAAGFEVHLPETVPYNDAGLSYGQVIESLYTP